jgi:hypothetical protein
MPRPDPSFTSFVYAQLLDGTELFGVRAFPFRRDHVDAVAFDLATGRRTITALDGRFRLFDPADTERLPSEALWLQANDDHVLRHAIKERCGL